MLDGSTIRLRSSPAAALLANDHLSRSPGAPIPVGMRARPRTSFLPALALALVLLLVGPGAASAGTNDPLIPAGIAPESDTVVPAGLRLSARDATRVADGVPRVREERAQHPNLKPDVTIPTYIGGNRRWQVSYRDKAEGVVEVHVDAITGRVIEVWTGPQVDFPLTRGYEPSVGRSLNKPYVWIPLALLFMAPFFDRRRPLRLLHLDLLMVLSFGLSQLYFNRGDVDLSVPLAYVPLVYLLGRMLLAAFRPREREGPLVPHAKAVWLVIGLVLLMGFRTTLNVTDSTVIDVGYASVVGADRIAHGEELYTDNEIHGDAYGPVNYLVYLPFQLALPSAEHWDDVPAAHAATIAFDLLTLLALILLGTRIRPGPAGRKLGLALAYAWAACPFTLYVMQSNTNDSLVALLLVLTLAALSSPPGRGALLALGAAAKFVPLALAPLFATGTGERRVSSWVRFSAAFAVVLGAAVIAYIPDGGLRELYNTTIGYQLDRESPFSLWGLHGLGWLQDTIKVGAVLLAAAVAFVPRRRDFRTVAALGAAVIIAFQLTAIHWFYYYVVWFLPFVLVACFCAYRSFGDEGESAADLSLESEREPVAA